MEVMGFMLGEFVDDYTVRQCGSAPRRAAPATSVFRCRSALLIGDYIFPRDPVLCSIENYTTCMEVN
jgi:hypothetical protein